LIQVKILILIGILSRVLMRDLERCKLTELGSLLITEK